MRLRKIKRLTLRLQPLHLLFHGLLRIGLSATSNPSCQSTIGLGHQCSGSGRLCTRCDCRVPTTHNCLHGYKFVRARSLFCFFFARALVRSVSVLQFQPAHATSSISISISIAFLIFSSLLRFSLSLLLEPIKKQEIHFDISSIDISRFHFLGGYTSNSK